MATQTIRDSPLGQLVRLATKNKAFQYPEEQPGFELPWKKADLDSSSETPEASQSRPASIKRRSRCGKMDDTEGTGWQHGPRKERLQSLHRAHTRLEGA